MLLFLIGLITGFVVMNLKNPRMGLSAHMEAVMNGMFLVGAGLVWNDLNLSDKMKSILFITLLYGTFANWIATLLSAVWGTSEMTPIAGAGFTAEALHENIIKGLLYTLALAMVFSLSVLVYGLRGKNSSK